MLFLASEIGSRNTDEHFERLNSPSTRSSLAELARVITLGKDHGLVKTALNEHYETFLSSAPRDVRADRLYTMTTESVKPWDVASLQFTSGTLPFYSFCHPTSILMFAKAQPVQPRHPCCHICKSQPVSFQYPPSTANGIYSNILNNARFIGENIQLTEDDIICCPPPLFHCLGLVIGFLGCLIHGSTIVFPSDHFNANLVLDTIVDERCTTLYGVPTMFIAELEANQTRNRNIKSLQKGLAAGSTVPLPLMNKLKEQMGIETMVIAYGMTETGPVTFMSTFEDPVEKRVGTVGRVMPHTGAKVIDKMGRIVKNGERGELCTSGYALHRGYLNDEEKTKDVMKKDEEGTVWMHTGDEGMIDELGYCHITGRIKDIIIRGMSVQLNIMLEASN